LTLDQCRQQVVGDVQQSRNIGVDHGVPVLKRHLRRRCRSKGQAGIVDQDVDCGKLLRQFSESRTHRLLIGNVEGQTVEGRSEFIFEVLEPLGATAGADHLPAMACKETGGGKAEARGRSGDKNRGCHICSPLDGAV